MTNLHIQEIERKFTKKIPVLRPGYHVRVHQKIKEGEKERVQIFEGLVIALNSGLGASKTVTVRKVVEGIGVEKIFPIYSPNVAKIEVKKTFGVRRAKLYYLRKAEGLSARLRAKLGLTEKDEKHSAKNAPANDNDIQEEIAEEVAAESAPAETAAQDNSAEDIKTEEAALAEDKGAETEGSEQKAA